TLRNGVRDNAVEAGGGEDQSESSEERKERGDEALASPTLRVEPPIEGAILSGNELRVHFTKMLLHGADDGGWVSGGASEDLHVGGQNKTVGKKDRGADWASEAVVARVADNADD